MLLFLCRLRCCVPLEWSEGIVTDTATSGYSVKDVATMLSGQQAHTGLVHALRLDVVQEVLCTDQERQYLGVLRLRQPLAGLVWKSQMCHQSQGCPPDTASAGPCVAPLKKHFPA